MEAPMWFIGIQVTIFGFLFAAIGVIFPIRQERKLAAEKEKLNALKEHIEKTERLVLELSNKLSPHLPFLEEVKRKEDKKNEIFKEIMNRYGKSVGDDVTSEIMSEYFERLNKDYLL